VIQNRWLLIVISAGLLLLGLHPLDLACFSWFAFIPLFILLFDVECRFGQFLLYALCLGVIYFGIGLYWLLYFDIRIYVVAFLVVAPTYAIYFGALRGLYSKSKNTQLIIFSAPCLWLVLNQVFAVSPLGTIAVEVPFYGGLPFFQLASVTGLAVVPAAILGMNAALAALLKKRSLSHGVGLVFFVGILAGVHFWGEKRIGETQPSNPEVKFALVQHNFPVSGKWRLEHPLFIRSEYRRLALEAAKDKPDIIVFPLYSFPDDALRSPEFFTGLAQETHTWILVATYIPQKVGDSITNGFFDAALLYSPEGKLADYYQAVQAPPFRHVSEATGNTYKILETPFGKLGILLCYEDSLPKIARQAVKSGAEILVALSNPGQFSTTHMPYYHLMQDRLRAIESNRWLVRASANGYSALVDPRGRFVEKSDLNKAQILQVKAGSLR
jgi:apolipoprotein N-acyltransferase